VHATYLSSPIKSHIVSARFDLSDKLGCYQWPSVMYLVSKVLSWTCKVNTCENLCQDQLKLKNGRDCVKRLTVGTTRRMDEESHSILYEL
jgi:hypothetical protein